MKISIPAFLSVKTLLILLGAGLLMYTGLRADRLSMTHDESSTYLNTASISVWECFYEAHCWQTANLHMTNTLGMQMSIRLFGTSEWALRLPNVLGHLVYLIFSFLLVTRLSRDAAIQVMGFLVLNANPFLLDFFSLARGYGLANVGMMVSLYYLMRQIQEPKAAYAWGIALGGAFAVLSNFTWLIFYAALGAAIVLVMIAGKGGLMQPSSLFKGGKTRLQVRWQALIPWLIVAGGMAILLWFPITQLSKLGEFTYGLDSLWLSFYYLISDSVYGESYFSGQTIRVFKWMSVVLSLAAFTYAGRSFWKRENSPEHRYFQVICALVGIMLLGLVMQYYLLGAKYVIHRKAVIFIPLGGLMLMQLVMYVREKWQVPAQVFAWVIAVFAVWHGTRFANDEYCLEWIYDADTEEMVDFLEAQVPEGETILLGLDWRYTHTAEFYRQTRQLTSYQPIEYSKEIRTDDYFDYYYLPKDSTHKLNPAYEYVRNFEFGGELYKRK